YEIMRPETVGASRSLLVLGKHSGRHAVKARLAELGYRLSDEDLHKAFERFKILADKKKAITDADLEALVADELFRPEELFTLDGLQVACGTMGLPTATVRLIGPNGDEMTRAALGTGPVDAAFKAIRELTSARITLLEFAVQSVTQGIDALGEVTVRVRDDSGRGPASMDEPDTRRTYLGHGADTDIVVAGAKAYLMAVNKVLVAGRGRVVE
ncbi:MAG: 2-isopropylmalate synthase, partial [Deltaproteobacteria bacterium]|nr:2-isopropylmalate synthase [Deltaproteobacteria bacterium]